MTKIEYKRMMSGICLYGLLGVVCAWNGWLFGTIIFGGLMILRSYPGLSVGNKKEEKDQNKG